MRGDTSVPNGTSEPVPVARSTRSAPPSRASTGAAPFALHHFINAAPMRSCGSDEIFSIAAMPSRTGRTTLAAVNRSSPSATSFHFAI